MGHAVNRARLLDAQIEQLAVWDGNDRGAPAGTARDVQQWRALGLASHVIAVPQRQIARTQPAASVSGTARSVRGILFADFHGFSRLRDQHFTTFVDVVMAALAEVLERHGEAVLWRNTWGDAIQAICDDVVTTASCALGFQEAVSGLDLKRAGLPDDLRLRIGAHVGPVMAVHDRVLGRHAFMGRELTRAARIEPLTPTGEVYVTDAFAAVLAVDARGLYATEYVGRITTAKNFETIPMYRLHRAR
jgi:class 3 adenylate cyclase